MSDDISPELQALFDKGKEIEAQIPACAKCGGKRTFLGAVPGVECRACGARWLYSLPSGREIEVEKAEIFFPNFITGEMWVPKKDKS
jgi:hypothetical protein